MSKTSGTTGSRRTKARYLTETAVLTALLIVLQAVTKPPSSLPLPTAM